VNAGLLNEGRAATRRESGLLAGSAPEAGLNLWMDLEEIWI
jgi:hypothetical protein